MGYSYIKQRLFFFFIYFLFLIPVYSSANAELPLQSNVIILTEAKDLKEMKEYLNILKEAGGIIYHRFSPDSFIGYLPDDAEKKLIGHKDKFRIIRDSFVEFENLSQRSKTAKLALKIWKKNFYQERRL